MSVAENLEQSGESDFSPERAMRLAGEVLGRTTERKPRRPHAKVVLDLINQPGPGEHLPLNGFIGPRIPDPIVLGEN